MPFSENRKSPWIILLVVLLASVAAPLNQFKVPPLMPLLMDTFRLPAGRAGLLMSIFAVTGLFLAVPAGFIFQKAGCRITGLLAIASLVVGAILGAMSGKEATLLASRIVEGAGMSLISVAAPAILAMWFVAERRGKAMGIWAIWVPLGSTAMFILAPLLTDRWNWRSVWWFGAFYTLVVGLLYAVYIRTPPRQKPGSGAAGSDHPPGWNDLKGVLRHRALWLISLVFCCFNLAFIGFVTWAPTFLHEIRGRSLANASLVVSLMTMMTLFSCPLAGWVSDRMGSRKWICVIPMVLLMLLFPISFYVSGKGMVVLVTALGFIGGFVPTGVFSAGIEAVGDERLGGMAMAVIQIGQNAGMLLGPLVLGWAIESVEGWGVAFWILAPVSALGALAGWMARVR
jgi:MFS family permease